MQPLTVLCCLGVLLAQAVPERAQAVIEGRVSLPKAHAAPVMNKRYDIVTKGGVEILCHGPM